MCRHRSPLLVAEGDIEVAATATSGLDLIRAYRVHHPAIVVIEGEADDRDAIPGRRDPVGGPRIRRWN